MSRYMSLIVVLLLLLGICNPQTTYAQNKRAAEEKYKSGVLMAQKGKCNEARKLFEASMKLDASKENKSKCNKAMKKLCPPSPAKNTDTQDEKIQAPSLWMASERVHFKSNGGKEDISVMASPPNMEWTIQENGDSHNEWCKVNKSSTSTITIECSQTDQTTYRLSRYFVVIGDIRKELFVTQEGKPVTLCLANEKDSRVKVRKKGGQQTVRILCNSDTLYNVGDNQTSSWKVVTMPLWCKQKVHAGLNTGEELLVFDVEPNTSGSLRADMIVIESQDRQLEITVEQRK